MWYVVVFSFSFFRGREGKRGKACIGSLSKSRIHGFTIFLMHIVAESHRQRSLCKKPHVEISHRSEEDSGRSHRQTDRHTDLSINYIGTRADARRVIHVAAIYII